MGCGVVEIHLEMAQPKNNNSNLQVTFGWLAVRPNESFFKVLGHKFSFKSIPNILWLFQLLWKTPCLSKNCWCFCLGQLLETFYFNIYSHCSDITVLVAIPETLWHRLGQTLGFTVLFWPTCRRLHWIRRQRDCKCSNFNLITSSSE